MNYILIDIQMRCAQLRSILGETRGDQVVTYVYTTSKQDLSARLEALQYAVMRASAGENFAWLGNPRTCAQNKNERRL